MESRSVPVRNPNKLIRATRSVLVHGLVYFGRVFADLMDGSGWSFRYYPDSGMKNLSAMLMELRSCDLVYQIGGRVTRGKFLRTAHLLRKPKIVMHWVGSDTLDEQKDVAEGLTDRWVAQGIVHWAESEWMQREVKALGLSCELVPLPSALVPDAPVPLPAQFRVLVYVPTVTRSELYGLDRVLDVAQSLPEVPFDLVGLLDGPIPDVPANLHVHPRIPDLRDFYLDATVVWRPVRHDGLSWMVLEALGYGRHVMWSYPFPACLRVNSAEEAHAQIVRLYALHQSQELEVNRMGSDFIARRGYHPQALRQQIHTRLEAILQS